MLKKSILAIKALCFVAILLTVGCQPSSSSEGETETTTPDLMEGAEAASTPEYKRDTIVFSLSWMSNINSGMVGTAQELQEHAINGVNKFLANDTVISKIGTWKPIWGPVTYSNQCAAGAKDCVTDNTMVLLKRIGDFDAPEYVLAIAGTNKVSPFGWFTEDFNVKQLVIWPDVDGQGANFNHFRARKDKTKKQHFKKCISKGTSIGLRVLLDTMTHNNVKLIDYLAQNVGNKPGDMTINVTGHSLGGALSPTTALALQDYQDSWNKNRLTFSEK